MLGVEEEEELVLDERATEIASVLIAGIGRLERRSWGWRLRKRRGERAAAEEREPFAVEIVRSGARGDVDSTRRCELVRKVERRLAYAEFLNGACGNIFCGRAHRLVADVHTVHGNSRGAPKSAAERNRGEADFGGIEVRAVLHLNAGFELREVEEVASVDREVFDLLFAEHTLHAGLLGIYRDRLGLHFDDGAPRTHRQREIRPGCFAYSHDDSLLHGLKALSLSANRIIPRDDSAGGVGAAGRRGHMKSLAGVFIADGNFRGRNNPAAGIQNRALNAAGGNCALAHGRVRCEGLCNPEDCEKKSEEDDFRCALANHVVPPSAPAERRQEQHALECKWVAKIFIAGYHS